MKSILLLTLSTIAISAYADLTVVEQGKNGGEVATFSTENVNTLKPEEIRYSYRIADYSNWSASEKKVLNLYDGFQPRADIPLVMYIAKMTYLLDKPADKINISLFVNKNIFSMVDPEGSGTVVSTVLSANDVITYKDSSSHYRNPPAPARWCDGTNVLCAETLFKLPGNYAYLFKKYEEKKGSTKTDLRGQSELKTYSGPELKNAADLSALTGIKTAPVASAVQSSFWFTHMLSFAKTVVIFQPHPTNANQTIATTYMAFAIDKTKWDMVINIPGIDKVVMKDVFLGKSAHNQKSGILCGLPCITKDSALTLATIFNH